MPEFTCADCPDKPCRRRETERFPAKCPSRGRDPEEVLAGYTEEERALMHEAAMVESMGYGRHTRVEEIMHFAHRMGWKRLGLAFCVGLSKEAAAFVKVLRANGFEVETVCCKVCSIPKEALGIREEEKVRPGQPEALCNPRYQAEYLNEAGVELQILLGLCVGHDTIFLRHSRGPVTVLAAKDRALGHNPLAALYGADGYFQRICTFIERLRQGRA